VKKLFATRRRKVFALVAVLALVAVSAALAGWFIGAIDGNGGGKAGSAQTIGTLHVTAAPEVIPPAQRLTPGADGGLGATFQNPTSGTLTITSVSLAGPVVADPPCDTSAVSLNAAAIVGNVFGPGTTGPIVLNNALHASPSFSEGCQNATLTVPLQGTTSGTGP
jgi:hypothetical protein